MCEFKRSKGVERTGVFILSLEESKPYVNLEEIPEFKEGDWAFSPIVGWGKIVLIDNLYYQIVLKCVDNRDHAHTKDGKYTLGYKYRCLFTVSEAKLLFNLEPPKEKDELDIMLEKAIEFYGTDTLKAGTELVPDDISFKKKERFINHDGDLLYRVNDVQNLALSFFDLEFRPIVLGYSNDKEPKPLVKGTKCTAVTPGGYTLGVIFPFEITTCKFFISNEEAIEYGKTLRKLKVEITEAEYELIKNMRNDSKTL